MATCEQRSSFNASGDRLIRFLRDGLVETVANEQASGGLTVASASVNSEWIAFPNPASPGRRPAPQNGASDTLDNVAVFLPALFVRGGLWNQQLKADKRVAPRPVIRRPSRLLKK